MEEKETIDHIEFPARDIDLAKNLFSYSFYETFFDHGLEDSCLSNAGLEGGFDSSDHTVLQKRILRWRDSIAMIWSIHRHNSECRWQYIVVNICIYRWPVFSFQ